MVSHLSFTAFSYSPPSVQMLLEENLLKQSQLNPMISVGIEGISGFVHLLSVFLSSLSSDSASIPLLLSLLYTPSMERTVDRQRT